MEEKNREAQLIVELLKARIDRDSQKRLLDFDAGGIQWPVFKDIAVYHELMPFLYPTVKKLPGLSPELVSNFENEYYCTLVRCQHISLNVFYLAEAFQREHIDFIPLKGAAFIHDLYADNPARAMCDIDVLVKETEFVKAEKLLDTLGYRKELYNLKEKYWKEKQYHIVFCKKNSPLLEVHWGLDYPRRNQQVLDGLWGRTRIMNVEGRTIQMLSPEDTLFCLALHERRFGKTLCLKNVYDAFLLLHKYEHDFDWEYCLSQSRKYRLNATLFFILSQMEIVFDAEFFQRMNVKDKIPLGAGQKKKIRTFITKNTFLPWLSSRTKEMFVRKHLLVYDGFVEPVSGIMNIPQEQFAKFYGLKAYDTKTEIFYRWRIIYIFLRTISDYFFAVFNGGYKKRIR